MIKLQQQFNPFTTVKFAAWVKNLCLDQLF